MSFWNNKKILITGGAGFLGSHVIDKLISEKKVNLKDIYVPRSKKTDLRIWDNCLDIVKEKDIIIHLAASVGGIGFNRKYPATLFYDNAIIGIQLIEAARLANIKKIVIIGTVCSYPKYANIPFKEESIWDGYPEETNAPYGLAKKMLLVQAQSYRKQYDLNIIYLIPVNLYGPRDNFNPNKSHVIPALIKRMIDAKNADKKEIMIWGTGKPTREFLYVGDAADSIILATEHYDKGDPINIGTGREISIKKLANLIQKLTKYNGNIMWDPTKPDGQPRRCLDISKAKIEFNFSANIPLESGLKKTINWYIHHEADMELFKHGHLKKGINYV